MCSLLLYVKRISTYNPEYGRYAFLLGAVFIASNVLSGGLNFYLGSGGWQTVLIMKRDNIIEWSFIFVPFYIATECAPAAVFALVMSKYGEAVANNGEL